MSNLPLMAAPAPNLTDEERDLACRDMLDPYFATLANAAVNEGWTPSEVAAAMLGHAVDAIRTGAGMEAALEQLNAVIDALKGQQRH